MYNKYHNQKAVCLSRHRHDSLFEADYCDRLLAMLQQNEIYGYRVQVPFNLPAGMKHVVDFLVATTPDWNSGLEAHETKGYVTAAWKIKKKLFEETYPEIKYKTIFKEQLKGERICRLNNPILKRIQVNR